MGLYSSNKIKAAPFNFETDCLLMFQQKLTFTQVFKKRDPTAKYFNKVHFNTLKQR